VALTGATLIDGTGRPAISNATVVVQGGRIIGAGTDVRIPLTARRIDVTGKTIIPGLWEMHGHLMQVEWATVYLAGGITTARDMGNEIGFIVPFRDAIKSGRAIGPRILLAGLIDGGGPNAFGAVNATTPDEGRAAVDRYHQLGFEQMKLYDQLQPDVVGAIIAEAHKLGMTVTGHIPRSLTLLAAVDSGMDHVAHLPIRGSADSQSVKQIIDSLKAHGTVIDPTASWGEILGHSTAEPVETFQPGIKHLPPVLFQRISRMGQAPPRGITPDSAIAAAHARLARTLGIIKALHDAGVPVVAGTDEGVPAFSVYREIELYVQAGFTPMEALRAATAVPAKAMRLDGESGTVEVGKRADLLVLDANPLENISNIRTVNMVMAKGALYKSADLWRAAGFR
jgi:imidazolonepropionase-like amidohydrolase